MELPAVFFGLMLDVADLAVDKANHLQDSQILLTWSKPLNVDFKVFGRPLLHVQLVLAVNHVTTFVAVVQVELLSPHFVEHGYLLDAKILNSSQRRRARFANTLEDIALDRHQLDQVSLVFE